LHPNAPIRYRIPSGGLLLLERGHSFTHSFWPAVDSYEPDVRAALTHFLKPGDTFVDCGANIGYFSVMAGHLVGRRGQVVAIEANPVTRTFLSRNLQLNGFGTIVGCALSSSPGELELLVPKAGDVFSSLKSGGLVADDGMERFSVQGRTLDEVVSSVGLTRLDLVKMDIEGAELDVLGSARRVMCELRFVIICEYGSNTWPAFGSCKDDLLRLLEKRNYRVGVFDPANSRVITVGEDVWKSPCANLLLIPSERDHRPLTGTS